MNYWIFRGNADVFDIDTYLKTHTKIYWSVKHQKHQEEMMLGDKVLIWRSKGNSSNPYGVVALGEINELPKEKSLLNHPEFLAHQLWATEEVSEVKVGVSIISARLTLEEGMIDHSYFIMHSELAEMQLIKAKQGTNFKITKSQFDVISSLWHGESDEVELTEYGSYEGKTKLILHKIRERDVNLVRKAKENHLRKYGSIYCEACGMSFKKLFGFDYIEVHHKKPLANIKSGEVTKLSDLALLCANCHRAVHRIASPDPFADLIKIYNSVKHGYSS